MLSYQGKAQQQHDGKIYKCIAMCWAPGMPGCLTVGTHKVLARKLPIAWSKRDNLATWVVVVILYETSITTHNVRCYTGLGD